MTDVPSRAKRRQLGLGFDVQAQSPASANVDVLGGQFFDRIGAQVYVQAAQVAGPFALCTGPARVRWDLVYLDPTGAVAIEQGVEQAAGVPDFTGAPGVGGPTIFPNPYPLAYVMVDEFPFGTVSVDPTDITDIRALSNSTLFNVDGVNPSDVTFNTPAPGVSTVFARRDHVHQIDAALQAALALPNVRSTTLHWTPNDNSLGQNPYCLKWILHHFQGKAFNDPTFWFDLAPGLPEGLQLWPVDNGGGVPGGPNVGLGFADDTDPVRAASVHGWLYVYLIGNPSTGDVALVYSSSPPSVGPVLITAPLPDYSVWRWVTCLEVALDFTGLIGHIVPMRKYDNLVIKEQPTGNDAGGHLEDLRWQGANFAGQVSLAEHVSPMAMSVFMNWHPRVFDFGGVSGRIDYYLGGATGGNVMGAQSEMRFSNPQQNKFFQLLPASAWGLSVAVQNGTWQEFPDGWWTVLDATRQFYLSVQFQSGGELLSARVIAYMEHCFEENAVINWNLLP